MTIRKIAASLYACVVLSACQSGVDATGLDTTNEPSIVGSTEGDLTVVAELQAPTGRAIGRSAPLAENDLLEIDVFQVDSLDREARIDGQGFISLPLIGAVQAAGLTVSELEQSIEQRYGRDYLQAPEVSVFIKESFGQRVTMDGEFRRPGIIPVTGQSTLLQTVSQAGGLTEIADPDRLFVFREFEQNKQVASYSISAIRRGDRPDPIVYGGDVIVAFPSNAKIAARNLREALGIARSVTSLASPL